MYLQCIGTIRVDLEDTSKGCKGRFAISRVAEMLR